LTIKAAQGAFLVVAGQGGLDFPALLKSLKMMTKRAIWYRSVVFSIMGKMV